MPAPSLFIGIGVLLLFLVLGKAADIVVTNTRRLAHTLGVPLFFIGLLLGALTSTPELAIGLNSLAQNAMDLSTGNLLGGILVIFCVILGVSAILNRRIATDGRVVHLFPVVAYLLMPFGFAFDGRIETIEGIFLMVLYFFLLAYMYETFAPTNNHHAKIKHSALAKEIFLLLGAVIVVIVSSNAIVRGTVYVLNGFHIPTFFIGLIIFSLGTNLPELIVTIRAWRKKLHVLSWSNLVGSAITNVFLIGLFATLQPIAISVNASFVYLSVAVLLLLVLVLAFYHSGRELTRREGIVLLAFYAVYVVGYASLLRPA